MRLAPIVLFVYNRPWHTRQTLTYLKKNDLASESKLYVFCDGPRPDASSETLRQIAEVRTVVREEQWCGTVEIVERTTNAGLADSIIEGITKLTDKYGKVIVLEDDLVTSTGFLRYMNDALRIYEQEERVMHVCAYMHPIDHRQLPETLFFSHPNSWGWGTWKRAWQHLNTDVRFLMKSIKDKYYFNIDDCYPFFSHLRANLSGELKTWAVRWQASVQLKKGLVLYPNQSLVKNIGWDGSGENCLPNSEKQQEVIALAETISVTSQPVVENRLARNRIKDYFSKKIKKPNLVSRIKWNVLDFVNVRLTKNK